MTIAKITCFAIFQFIAHRLDFLNRLEQFAELVAAYGHSHARGNRNLAVLWLKEFAKVKNRMCRVHCCVDATAEMHFEWCGILLLLLLRAQQPARDYGEGAL